MPTNPVGDAFIRSEFGIALNIFPTELGTNKCVPLE